MEDEYPPDVIRAPAAVAYRALALFSVVGLALGADRGEVKQWLSDNDLWKELTPSEAGFVDTPVPSRKQIINASWFSECLIVLAWALHAIDHLPPADEQCDTAIFQQIFPPYAEVTVLEFVAGARLRDDADLIAMADEILMLHWEARDARLNDHPPRKPVDMEIIQERHHAINWIIGYDGAEWDEVTADT